jgi:hypothetical protein
MTDEKDDLRYEVGYKRPPSANQFKPGQSGNRKGRPKGSLNFMTVIDQELNTVVPVRENGKSTKVSKKRIIAKQIVNKAAAGDLKASAILLNQARMNEQTQQLNGNPVSEVFAHEDQVVLTGILKRIRENLPGVTLAASEHSAADPDEGALS